MLALTALLGSGPAPANVFGDGDPANGTEDDRRALSAVSADAGGWQTAAGTIYCDGELRGSAMLVDMPAAGVGGSDLFLATAAHVFIDLERQTPFVNCTFNYLALAQVPGMQVAIDPAQLLRGAFDAGDDLQSPAFGAQDWAFIRLDGAAASLGGVGRVRAMAWQDARGTASDYMLVAWDAGSRRMMVSAPCQVRESTLDDLGGGAWPGQLLDDCDSGMGASGGGLLARTSEGVVLVGIRTGAHWSPQGYPPAAFPHGPPAGAPWDAQHNTNFARALDRGLLRQLTGFATRPAGDGE